MSPAQTLFIIADYRYIVLDNTPSDTQTSRRLHLVHHRRVLHTPPQQSSSRTPTPTLASTETGTQTYADSAVESTSDNMMRAEEPEGGHCAMPLPLAPTRKPEPRRLRQNRRQPYPSALDRTAAARTVMRQTKKHTSTSVASPAPPVVQVQKVDRGIEAEVARNYERRAQRMRASVKLYPDDDECAGTEGNKEMSDDERDHPYNPAHAAATATYFRCLQWLRNVHLYAPPDL